MYIRTDLAPLVWSTHKPDYYYIRMCVRTQRREIIVIKQRNWFYWPDRPWYSINHSSNFPSVTVFLSDLSIFVLASPNMVGSKLALRMTTLHEETSNVGNQLPTPINDEDEEKSDADYSEYDSYQVVHVLWSIRIVVT